MGSHTSFEQDLVKGYWQLAAKMETHNYPRTAREVMMENLLEMVGRKEIHMLLKVHLMVKADCSVIHSYLKHHWTQERSVLIRSSWISD